MLTVAAALGLNKNKRFIPRTDQSKGRIIDVESPLHVSNVQLIDPVSGKGTRVNWVKQETGVFERVTANSQSVIPRPAILAQRRKPKPEPTSKCTAPEVALLVTYVPPLV